MKSQGGALSLGTVYGEERGGGGKRKREKIQSMCICRKMTGMVFGVALISGEEGGKGSGQGRGGWGLKLFQGFLSAEC